MSEERRRVDKLWIGELEGVYRLPDPRSESAKPERNAAFDSWWRSKIEVSRVHKLMQMDGYVHVGYGVFKRDLRIIVATNLIQ